MSGRLRDASGGEGSAIGPSERPVGETPLVVGYIQSVVGSGTLTRAHGAVARAKVDNSVCRGDVIETAADGQIAIHFIDDTVFNLSGNSRLALNEFVCGADGTSRSDQFDGAPASFASRAGQAAKAVSPATETRVESNQHRARSGGFGSLSLAGMTFAILDKAQAQNLPSTVFFHNGAFLDDDIITYKDLNHGIVELIIKGNPGSGPPEIKFIDNPGESILVRNGSSTVIANTPAEMAALQSFAPATLAAYVAGVTGAAAANRDVNRIEHSRCAAGNV